MKLLQSFLLLFFPALLIAQGSISSVDALIDYTNAQLKTNDALVNGKPFIFSNTKVAGSPFFSPEFIPSKSTLTNDNELSKQVLKFNLEVPSGTVFKKDGSFTEQFLRFNSITPPGTVFAKGGDFAGQSLRYNLEVDALILSKTLNNGVPVELVLNDNLVDSFSIAQHFFISKRNMPKLEEQEGYIERIFQGNFIFYRLQKIQFSNQFTEKNPHGKYTEPQVSYYAVLPDNESVISSLKDFATLFPNHKKEIIRFAKKRKIRFRNATLTQLTQLMNFCDEKI